MNNQRVGNRAMNLQQWRDSGDYFDFEGHQVFSRIEGDGPPLLLIHGYPTASWDWNKIWPQLTDKFQCITLDMLGFGFSDKPRQPYSISTQADIYIKLLEQQGVKACHIVSHDYGDTVAQELLARHNENSLPFKVCSLNLLNGGLFPETHRPVLIQKLLLSPLGSILVRLMNRETLARNLRKIFAPNTPPTEQEIDEFWYLINHNNGHLVMHRLIHYMVERRQNRSRWVEALQFTDVPLRLTDGMLDPISGAHLVARYKQLIPNADIICLQDVGHYPQIEAPQLVLSSILTKIQQSLI